MHIRRIGILTILLSGSVACAVLYPVHTVQAKGTPVSDALVRRVFSAASLALRYQPGSRLRSTRYLKGRGKPWR